MGTYERLGVRRIVNASATLTRLGGSVMPPVVREAMVDGAGAFVDLVELQRAVSREIARLTHNDAAYVPSGAAAGLVLVTAALITGTDESKVAALPLPEGPKHEVLIHACQRFGYDFAVRSVGVHLREFGPPRAPGSATTLADLEAAFSDRTLYVLYLAGLKSERGALPVEDVIRSAHDHGIPVVVDAAAQLPPAENLWHYTRDLGADLAIFSGGKGLCGPQPTGLVLGRPDIIEGIYPNAVPNARIGRPMKVGKEELCGILAAVEWYLSRDEPATLRRYEEVVQLFVEGLSGLPGVVAERDYPSEAGQPHPRCLVTVDPAVARVTRDDLMQCLWEGEPRIAVAAAPDGGIWATLRPSSGGTVRQKQGIWLNPQTLADGEELIVLRRLREVLGG